MANKPQGIEWGPFLMGMFGLGGIGVLGWMWMSLAPRHLRDEMWEGAYDWCKWCAKGGLTTIGIAIVLALLAGLYHLVF